MYIHSCKINAGLLPPAHCEVEIGRKARGRSREREGERKKGKQKEENSKERNSIFVFILTCKLALLINHTVFPLKER